MATRNWLNRWTQSAAAATPDAQWSPVALELLSRQNRFTSAQIVREFEARRDTPATVPLDGARRATPVVDDRYCVIWSNDGGTVRVDAVVALPIASNSPAELKQSLAESLEYETRGMPEAGR